MRTLAFVLATALALAGCLTGDDEPHTSTPTSTHTMTPTSTASPAVTSPTPAVEIACDVHVEIKGFAYSPANVTIARDESVCWWNNDTVAHTVTFDHGFYDSGEIAPGARVATRIQDDGLHAYHCKLHPAMRGSVQVGTPAPTPTPTPTPTPSPTPPTGSGSTGAVTILAFSFTPATVTIARGGSVTWTNSDPVPHTATGSGWDTGNLANGEKKAVTFATAGTFDYRCNIHPAMTGKVVVT